MNELTSSNEVESRSEPTADQIRPVRILTAFLQKKTIPHALLFTGIDGVGKNRIATIFAMTANCADQTGPGGSADAFAGTSALNPCGSCRSCRKIEKGLHPDILRVQPDGRTIRIHQIRTLIETLSLKPMEARWRFVIMEQADTMRPAAANALLKTLEEPPDRTVLILMAGQAADLLPTIVSRCRHVRFHPVSTRSITDRLVNDHGFSAAEAALAAAASEGSISRAMEIGKPGWVVWRNWLIAAGGLDSPQDLSHKPMGELLAFAEQLSKNKARVSEALEIMTGWLRDLIVVRHNKDHVINTDCIEALQELAQQLPTGTLMTKIDIIRAARHRIEANSNLRLTLEAMVLRLSQDCVKKDRLISN